MRQQDQDIVTTTQLTSTFILPTLSLSLESWTILRTSFVHYSPVVLKMLARLPAHQDKAMLCIAHLLTLHNAFPMQTSGLCSTQPTYALTVVTIAHAFICPVVAIHASYNPSAVPLAVLHPNFELQLKPLRALTPLLAPQRHHFLGTTARPCLWLPPPALNCLSLPSLIFHSIPMFSLRTLTVLCAKHLTALFAEEVWKKPAKKEGVSFLVLNPDKKLRSQTVLLW